MRRQVVVAVLRRFAASATPFSPTSPHGRGAFAAPLRLRSPPRARAQVCFVEFLGADGDARRLALAPLAGEALLGLREGLLLFVTRHLAQLVATSHQGLSAALDELTGQISSKVL